MKREDLEKLGLSKEQIDSVMTWNGEDVNTHKTNVTNLQSQLDAAKTQLGEANTTIESFKAMKPEELKAAADDWKAKFDQAQTDAAAQLASLKFDHALESALVGAKVKNSKAVSALLSKDALKYNEADGSIVGLNEQLEKIKSENDYLFTDAQPVPKIVTSTNSKTVLSDPATDAMRKAAGLPIQK